MTVERHTGDRLKRYRELREPGSTPEPPGERETSRREELLFVVQKHDASRLHYDLRLEWDGVLLSWAVPKGPVPDPGVRRLAVRTEDHPLAYADFEGVIPENRYGGGTMMVWDRGWWRPGNDPERGLAKGRLDFRLDGEKLSGRWSLVRTDEGEEGGRKAHWLLFKRNDEAARPGSGAGLLEERTRSVLTGREMAQIAAGADGEATPSEEGTRGDGPVEGGPPENGERAPLDPAAAEGARSASLPEAPVPQLATLIEAPPAGDAWLHEIKHDGYRLLCRVERAEGDDDEVRVRLFTRNGHDWTGRFPEVAQAAAALPVRTALLDGEAVVQDDRGRSDFGALQAALSPGQATGVTYFAFDLLHLDGFDLTRSPLRLRKELLARLLDRDVGPIRISEHVRGRGAAVHREACRLGLEGIVSKRAEAPYTPGRGRSWRKVKCLRRQELVVVGWTEPRGSRVGLGALVLAVHDERGRLVRAGRVGTGFDAEQLRALRARLAPLEREDPPVVDPPTGARARSIHWVRPELVAEVTFTGWTTDGALRHPVFVALREDKDPGEVVREEAAPSTAGASGRRPTTGSSGPLHLEGVPVTSPDRVLWPRPGITKEELARYWIAVAPVALPLLRDRPLTLVRCPEGIGTGCFHQKHEGAGVPEVVPRVDVDGEGGEPYLALGGVDSLVALVRLGVVEIHPWGARTDRLERPDRIVMDLDPGPEVPFQEVRRAALALRDVLAELSLASWPRATGGKGLHVVLPLVRRQGWAEAKAFARALSELMSAADPKRFVATAARDVRRGRIYVDYLRNGRGATAIGTFSPRARPGAPVAHPLSWDEVAELDAPPHLSLRRAGAVDWAARDPWAGFTEVRQSLTRGIREALGLESR